MSLRDIIEKHEVIILDSSALQPETEFDLCEQIYESKKELFYNREDILKLISNANLTIEDIRDRGNVFTINEVLEEMRDYWDILDGQMKYHRKNILKRKYGKPVTFRRGTKKIILRKGHIAYKDFDEIEEERFIYLNKYTMQLREILKILGRKTIKLPDEEVLDKIRQIPLLDNSKYIVFEGNHKKDRETDRKIIAVAYELALNGKDVAVVHNDSHISKILFDCFVNSNLLKLPAGEIVSYVRYSNPDYGSKFDTRIRKATMNRMAIEMQVAVGK